MMLFFQNLLHSVYTQSNEDKNPFHSFLQKLNSTANESLQNIVEGSLNKGKETETVVLVIVFILDS